MYDSLFIPLQSLPIQKVYFPKNKNMAGIARAAQQGVIQQQLAQMDDGEEMTLQLNVEGYLKPDLTIKAVDFAFQDAAALRAACTIDSFQYYNIHATADGNPVAASVGQAVGDIVALTVGRWQSFPTPSGGAAGPATAIGSGTDNWDSMQSGNNWYHYTFFPCVRRYKKIRRVMTYVAFYSSFDPWETARSSVAFGGEDAANFPTPFSTQNTSQAIPMSPPQWQSYTTSTDIVTGQSETVNVDMQYIGDDNCRLSIAAALENTRPANGSYLCFFPFVTPSVFRDEGLATYQVDASTERAADAWRINGASLGLATVAVILGMPSIHYTGYIQYLLPGEVLNKGPDWESNPIVPVSKQINFVEYVDEIPLKAAYCAANDLPFIMPNRDEFQKPVSSKFSRIVATIISFLPNVYTTADYEDGRQFMSQRSTPLCMVATVSEATMLSAFLWLYSRRFTSIYTAAILQNATAIEQASVNYFDARATRLAALAARNKQVRADWNARFRANPTQAEMEYIEDRENTIRARQYEARQKSDRMRQIQDERADNKNATLIRKAAATANRYALKQGNLTPQQQAAARAAIRNNAVANAREKKPKRAAVALNAGKIPLQPAGKGAARLSRQANPAFRDRMAAPGGLGRAMRGGGGSAPPTRAPSQTQTQTVRPILTPQQRAAILASRPPVPQGLNLRGKKVGARNFQLPDMPETGAIQNLKLRQAAQNDDDFELPDPREGQSTSAGAFGRSNAGGFFDDLKRAGLRGLKTAGKSFLNDQLS